MLMASRGTAAVGNPALRSPGRLTHGRDVGARMRPGSAAIRVVPVRGMTADGADELGKPGCTVLRTSPARKDYPIAGHVQSRTSGMSSPWAAMYSACSMSRSRIACFA
jgi:hypothetical protein